MKPHSNEQPWFPPIKIAPEPENHPNQTKMTHAAWQVFITARQFIQKLRKLGCRLVSPDGTGLHRQAVPRGNPKTLKMAYTAWRL